MKRKRIKSVPVWTDENGYIVDFLIPIAAFMFDDADSDAFSIKQLDKIEDTQGELSELACINEN